MPLSDLVIWLIGEQMADNRTTNIVAWTLGVALAALTGWLQIMFRDLHLALLAAMAFALTLSLIRPQRPWIWGLLIGLAPVVAEFYRIFRGEPVQRGSVEVAFGAVLPAFVGALGGYAMRVMVNRLFEKAPEPEVVERKNP
jgi:uncharacterized membrane protein YoaK (UPF0700 family)